MNDSSLLGCEEVIEYVHDFGVNIIQYLQIILNIINIVVIVITGRKIAMRKLNIHVNFKIILTNGCIFFLTHSVSILVFNLIKQIQYRMYADNTDPCRLFVVNWQCLIFRGFIYVCLMGFSLIHVSACIERLLATFYVNIYEKKGPKIGIFIVIFIWLVNILCLVYVYTDWNDGSPMDLKNYCSVLSTNGSIRFGHIHYVLLVLNIIITVVDFILLKFNKNVKTKASTMNYNLSKSYQLNENASTMKAIMPASIVHSIVFTIYLIAAIAFYYVTETDKFVSAGQQRAINEGIYLINTIYIFLIVIVLSVNVGKVENRQKVKIIDKNETDVYFKMFQNQIGAKKIILMNGFIFYSVHCITRSVYNIIKQIQLRTYIDPCDVYVTNWKCYIYRGFCYLSLLGFSLIHLSICIERLIATFYVHIYEKMGPKIGIFISISIWSINLSIMAYTFTNTGEDLQALKGYCSVLSSTTSDHFVQIHYALLVLNVVVSITDIILFKFNRDIKKKNLDTAVFYNLSKSYQLNEINATMKVIVPFAIVHSLIFICYLIAAIVTNYLISNSSNVESRFASEAVYFINTIYIFAILNVVRFFSDAVNQQVTIIRNKTKETDVYFEMFHTQIKA